MEKINFRVTNITRHLQPTIPSTSIPSLTTSPCLKYTPLELTEEASSVFDVKSMRKLVDGHNIEDRDWLFDLMMQSKLFNPKERGGKVFCLPDYNQSMEQQREMTMKRIQYLLHHGVFQGVLTGEGPEVELRNLALLDVVGIFDHSLAVKIGVNFFLWGGAIQLFGTKRHHDKWLKDTEEYNVKGCFAMTELGHGSNVRGIETNTTYDPESGEFVINTPCESAQKYWIGAAANDATHTIVFSQLNVNGINHGVHAFICQIRDTNGNVCDNIRVADCGDKIGLNGVDNGRIWFDNVRIPRENLLNSVADVSPEGKYVSAIKDPDQRFTAFLAPSTSGRVTTAVTAIYQSKISLAITIRYSLTRRAFSVTPNVPQVLILDCPSHQRRLLPLLAKTFAISFAGNYLKMLYVRRTPELIKTIHVVSCAFKATFTWHNMRTLQECREACGGQGLITENRVGHLMGEYDVQSTFEGDNNVLMQQVSKALCGEYMEANKHKKPFKGLGLEHMNEPWPVIPCNLSSPMLREMCLQHDIFCFRERHLLNRFVAEQSQLHSKGVSKQQAFVESYELAKDLGKAFSDRTILRAFIDAEATTKDGALKKMLGLLRSLFVLVTLDEDPTFLRYGYLSVENAAAVRKEVVNLCCEVRPHALPLVISFGIPDAFLGPLAFNWIEANSWSSIQN